MKNLLSEELKRYRILSNYNTKLTLTENTEIISKNSILNEQPGTTIKAAQKVLKGLGTKISQFTKMEASELTRILAMDEKAFAAELKKAMKVDIKGGQKVMVTANELSKIQVIREITSQKPTTVAEMNAIIENVKNSNTIKFKDLQLKTPIKPTTGGKGKTTTTGKSGKLPKSKVTKNNKKAKKERIKEPDPTLNKPTRWQTFKTKIVGMTKGKIFRYLLIAGGLYLAYKWWMDEGSTMFPDCISKNIPEEDFKKMAEQGLDYVLITDTGNSAIDKNGGGKFFDDKKFVTGNDKYTGTWDDTDSGIVITVGGTDYAMSCEGIEEETDDNGNGGGGGGGNWTDCTSFPYKKGCKSSDIEKAQECLGGLVVDGKFGRNTQDALVAKGYGTVLTQEVYDKIIANCGGTTTTTTTIWEPNRTEVDSDEYEK